MVLKLDEQKLAEDNQDKAHEVGNDRGGGIRTISRLNFLRVGILGGFGLLTWRLWEMQKPLDDNQAQSNLSKAAQADTRYISYKAPRGIIFDRNSKKLVTNQATFSVTLTANYLPDPAKGKTKEEQSDLSNQRQAVYDNLARFLGMNYYIVLIPEQINGLKNKQGVYTNPERNAILNELEKITSVSAKDWDKTLLRLVDEQKDKDLFVVNEKEPIPVEQFDHFKYLRTKFKTNGFLFQSDAELKMLRASNLIPAYQPVEVWPSISREDAMLLTEKRLDYPGVDVQINYIRQYEDPRLYAHLLGYTGHFSSQDSLAKANKKAQGDLNAQADPNDPSSKIDVYEIDDKIGVTGIESWMEEFLRGRKGANEVQVDSTGHILRTVHTGKPAQPGYSVTLSIDSDLQAFVASALQKQLDSKDPKIINPTAKVPEGAAVVLDVNTGEILAQVAFPHYNNNLYNKPTKEWTPQEIADMNDNDKAIQLNRAVSARYAPGSCFKLITAAAALNEKVVNVNTTFNCTHLINVPTSTKPTPSNPFKCWGTHGPQNILDAIKNSCDIYFYNVSVSKGTGQTSGDNRYYDANSNEQHLFNGMGIDALNGYMELFNLGHRTGVELPSEYSGLLPGPQTTNPKWSIGDTMTTSIGQGDLEVTPLQLCMVTACFANGGKLFQPQLVREVKDSTGKPIVPFEPKLIRDVTKDGIKWPTADPNDPTRRRMIPTEFRLEPSVIQVVRQGMLQVTSATGTAASGLYGKIGKLQVAGKTGTAEYGEIIGKDDKGNDARATRAWFTAFAPFDKPKYAVTALIASGGIGAEGSTFAVPIVHDILQKLFPEETKEAAK